MEFEVLCNAFALCDIYHVKCEILKDMVIPIGIYARQRSAIYRSRKRNKGNYPSNLRRVVYYAKELKRSFTYYTNNFYLKAKDIALLYRYRWQVELFFKWIKQHLKVKTFWGTSENFVRIQIHVAIITYCLIAIVEHDLKIGRPVVEVMRILGNSLLVKDSINELFQPFKMEYEDGDDGQLCIDFKFN